MAYSFLTPSNIFTRYKEAKEYTDKLTEPFPEFARIARNKPKDNLGIFPPVTDGTTASIIQKTPKSAVQQLPTGLIETEDDNDWLPIVAQFIYENKILPYANSDYSLFKKCHLVIEGGLTFGAQATFNRFARHSQGFGPDPELIYWGDLAIQKGKKSGPACDFLFYRTWWQKSDIEALIDGESQRAKQAKKNGEAYEATWDVEALKEVLDSSSQKDRQGTTPTEDERSIEANGIELVTGFQKGVNAKFYTFNPSTKRIVRTKVNKDPRGMMPIDWFYGDIDGTNPLGRGVAEVVGALQNLIDSRMQIAQYTLMYNTNPAILQYGQMDTDFVFEPNKRIRTNDPNAKVLPIEIKTSALDRYTETQSYLQSQLYQLVSTPHTNLQSGNSVVNDGKTPQALSMQQAAVDIDVNTIRKHFESWFESWSEGAINMWFAEHSGVEVLQLDDKTAAKLRQLPPSEDFDAQRDLNEKNELIINYDTATPELKFRVDASTSKMQDDANQIKAFQLVQQFVENSPQLTQLVPADKWIEIFNAVVGLAGIEDPEKLQISDDEKESILNPPQAAAPQPPTASQLPAGQMPADQPMADPEAVTQQHVDELRRLGVPDEQIAQAVQIYNAQRGMSNV